MKNSTNLVLTLVAVTSVFFGRQNIAGAGNTRSYLLGDEAVMTGGSGIAVSRDSGTLWYNPAGLGGLKLGRMELTGTVYQAKLRTVDKYLTANLPSGRYSTSASTNDIGTVPTSLVFVRNLSDAVSAGIGWYQTSDRWVEYRTHLEAPYGEGNGQWTQGAEFHQRGYTYHLGPAVGWQLNPRFRLGVALFFFYKSSTASYQTFASISHPDGSEEDQFYTLSQNIYRVVGGAMLTAGAQWQFATHWHAALVVRSPEFKVLSFGDSSELESGRIADESGAFVSSFVYDPQEKNNTWSFDPFNQMEIQIGLAYRTSDWWIGAEGAVRPPLNSMDHTLLWNASVGSRLQLAEKLAWGTGLFTDNSPNKKPSGAFEQQLDRFGLSTGFEFKTPLMVRQEPEEKQLIWATTLGAVYSFEVGQIAGIHMDPRESPVYSFPRRQVVFHHGYVHIGSSLYF